jgi:hypothetical protein
VTLTKELARATTGRHRSPPRSPLGELDDNMRSIRLWVQPERSRLYYGLAMTFFTMVQRVRGTDTLGVAPAR